MPTRKFGIGCGTGPDGSALTTRNSTETSDRPDASPGVGAMRPKAKQCGCQEIIMKKRISLLCVFCATLLPGGLQAWGAEETQKRPGARRPGRGAIIKKFDKDGDGKLNEEERKAARAAGKARHEEMRGKLLAEFDADKDGKLNEDERKAASKTRMELRWEGLPAEAKERITKRFDKDGDGKLSDTERKAAIAARRHRKGQRHKDGAGRPGPGRRGGSSENRPGRGRQGQGRQNKGPQGEGK